MIRNYHRDHQYENNQRNWSHTKPQSIFLCFIFYKRKDIRNRLKGKWKTRHKSCLPTLLKFTLNNMLVSYLREENINLILTYTKNCMHKD